jgi:hypothetical protein
VPGERQHRRQRDHAARNRHAHHERFKKRQIIEVKGSIVFILAKGKLEAMIGGA